MELKSKKIDIIIMDLTKGEENKKILTMKSIKLFLYHKLK